MPISLIHALDLYKESVTRADPEQTLASTQKEMGSIATFRKIAVESDAARKLWEIRLANPTLYWENSARFIDRYQGSSSCPKRALFLSVQARIESLYHTLFGDPGYPSII